MLISLKTMNHYGTPELLPNGLLRIYDYGCAWAHLFKKVDSEWKHYAGTASNQTKKLLERYVNEFNQPTPTQGRNEIKQ